MSCVPYVIPRVSRYEMIMHTLFYCVRYLFKNNTRSILLYCNNVGVGSGITYRTTLVMRPCGSIRSPKGNEDSRFSFIWRSGCSKNKPQ